jgi:hypothetical protein
MARPNLVKQGETLFSQVDKINAELLAHTYGALVVRLLQDLEQVEEVNRQLDTMGFNIGQRLVDDFLAKSGTMACQSMRDTAEVIAKVAFKMFLGVTCEVGNWSADDRQFSLILGDNPLTEIVELPEEYPDLKYLNILCGTIRGALEMVNIRCNCWIVRDILKGDDITELRIQVLEIVEDEYKPTDS